MSLPVMEVEGKERFVPSRRSIKNIAVAGGLILGTSAYRRRIPLLFVLFLLFLMSQTIGAKQEAKDHSLLGIVLENNKGKLSYNLLISGEFTYNSFLLEQPERLVIDLTGPDLASSVSTQELAGGLVKGVRVSRFDPNTIRVVFDLEYLVGYRLERLATQPDGLRLDFNAVLKDVGFLTASAAPEIYLDTSGPVNYKTDFLLNPHRLIVDVWDVTLTGPALTVPGNNNWVSSIRVSQFDSQTIRLVLDIKEPRNCMVAVDEANPGRLVIKTVPELVEASWTTAENGGQLTLKSTGILHGEPLYDPAAGKLYINLPYTELSAKLQASRDEASPFQIRKMDGSMVQVEIGVPKGYHYSIMWTPDRKVMTVELQNAPLSGKVIVLDPGHGGADAGAISPGGLREKELNLAVAARLKQKLEALGAEVLLTREDDRYLWLYDRVAIANRVGGAVLLSIHANNHDNRKILGLEVWHYPEREESAMLAKALADAVLARTGQHFRGIMSSKDFVIPREAEMPAVIFEMGFISNREEEKLLITEEFQDKIAEGLSQGLLDYFQVPAPDDE